MHKKQDGVVQLGRCNMHILRHLKQVLVWAIDKQVQFIGNDMLLKTVTYTTKELKNKAILSLKNIVFIAM